MSYSLKLLVAPGEGRLARRSGAVLFLPGAEVDAEFVALFLAAEHADLDDQLASYVLARNLEAPAFIFVSWPDAADGERMRAIVRGDATLTSDISSVPELSGAGSSTWVEHRVLKNPVAATLRGGAAGEAGTDLAAGVVPAGGFELVLNATTDVPVSRSQPTSTSTPSEAAQPDEPAPDEPVPADPELTITATGLAAAAATANVSDAPAADATDLEAADIATHDHRAAPGAITGLEALAAATGGDRTDDSLLLDPTGQAGPHSSSPAQPSEPVTETDLVEPHPAPGALHAAPPDDTPVSPDANELSARRAGGPPVFPGDEPDLDETPQLVVPVDPEVTVAEDDLRESPTGDRLASARLCPSGHPNSPHDSSCRVCTAVLDLDEATVTVEQPVLAQLRLPDGSVIPISGDVVVGRNPTMDSAQIDNGTLVPIAASSSVSRTHLRLSVDGWQLLVTDCGSRAGSAIVESGEQDPLALEPWMPHEVNGGDQIFLGGPTKLVIEESAG